MLLLTKYTVLYKENEICCIILLSLPSRERGLKYLLSNFLYSIFKSLPSRERGLKCYGKCKNRFRDWSLPSRERGLKFIYSLILYIFFVAPFAGAWIEIIFGTELLLKLNSRSLRGSVD